MKPVPRLLLVLLAIALLPCPCGAEETALPPDESWTTASEKKVAALAQFHKRAEEFIVLGQFRDAVEIYSEIILLEPDDDIAYSNMGHVYLILGDLGRAENAFLNALDINPSNQTALLGIQRIRDPDSAPGVIPDETVAVSSPSATQAQVSAEKIQTALRNAGLYRGRIDGKIGPGTLAAVRTFQASRGLEADGKVGLKTWAALEPYLEISNKKEKPAEGEI